MADARIESTSIGEDRQFNRRSMQMTDAATMKGVSPYLNPNLVRKAEYTVYVYSVVDPRPAGQSLMRHQSPLTKNLRIPELKPGERYVLVKEINHPVMQRKINNDSLQQEMDYHDARRVAQDIVNPANMTMNQDAVVDQSFSPGEDYGVLGVFWSMNNPPTDEEIAAAIKRKENFYRARLNIMRSLEATNPKALYEALSITDHVAADYFGEEFSWHKTIVRPVPCANCGEPIREGVAFHMSAALGGQKCVLDWKRTVEAGAAKQDDVPESKRWWKEKVKA